MWRQAADLEEVGKASGPDFWKRVKALGEQALLSATQTLASLREH